MLVDKYFNGISNVNNISSKFIGYDKKKKKWIPINCLSYKKNEFSIDDNIERCLKWLNKNFICIPICRDTNSAFNINTKEPYPIRVSDTLRDIEYLADEYNDYAKNVDNAVQFVMDPKFKKYFEDSYGGDPYYWGGPENIKHLKLDSEYRNIRIKFNLDHVDSNIETIDWPGLKDSEIYISHGKNKINYIHIGNSNSLRIIGPYTYGEGRIELPDIGTSRYKKLDLNYLALDNVSKLNADSIVLSDNDIKTNDIIINNEEFILESTCNFIKTKINKYPKVIDITCSKNLELGLLPELRYSKISLDCPNIHITRSSFDYSSYNKLAIKSIKNVSKLEFNKHNYNAIMNIYVDSLEINPNTNILTMTKVQTGTKGVNLFIKKLDFQNRKGVSIKCANGINVYYNGNLISNKVLSDKNIQKDSNSITQPTEILNGKHFAIHMYNKPKKFKSKTAIIASIQLNGGKTESVGWSTDYIITDDPNGDFEKRAISLYGIGVTGRIKCISEQQYLNLLKPKTKNKTKKDKNNNDSKKGK